MDSGKTKKIDQNKTDVKLSGIGVSAGIVIGRVLFVGRDLGSVKEVELDEDQVDTEIERFRTALKASEEQLAELRKRVGNVLGEGDARIFDAHLLVVSDESLVNEVTERIREEKRNAEFIFDEVINRYIAALNKVDDDYIRDRITDVRDVSNRVISNLRGEPTTNLAHLTEPRIVAANDLSPSETATMDKEHVMAFLTRIGSRTSHTAIMARALNVPAVVGITELFNNVQNGDRVILDGLRGEVIVHPDEHTVEEYKKRIQSQQRWFQILESETALPAETVDGFRVQLAANIELPDEVEQIRDSYGVGIGLFRSEYVFINEVSMPTEDEQFESYRLVAERIFPQSVIIRTLDIGGDKFLSSMRLPQELNPFLGMRAIRICLSQPEMFRVQLRAILRASAYGKVRIMFPMISTVEEVTAALEQLELAKKELKDRGIPFNPHPDVGIMIEVPAAALLADQLAPYVDFFSLGTNDLIQYSLAVDRANPEIAYLYQPSHPSIVRLIQQVVHTAYKHGKWVSICGEMAGEPSLVPLILGLGIHELSMSSVSLGLIKRLIRRMRMYDAENLVRKALMSSTAAEVRKLCDDFVRRVAPDLLPE